MTFDDFKTKYANRLKQNEPMSRHTSFHVGGPAKYYFEAKTVAELNEALSAAKSEGLKVAVLGGGTNSLFSDSSFNGLVLMPALREVKIEGERVTAEAGVLSAVLARQTAEKGLTGFEWAASLPGTIGGAVRGNAGCFGGETRDNLVEVKILRHGEAMTLSNFECKFGYRESSFKHNDDVVLSATFELKLSTREICVTKINDVLEKRKKTQPAGVSSAGCMFKNFEFTNESEIAKLREAHTVPPEMIAKKMIPAGWLIDQAELKGFCVGTACVSEAHGNFLVVQPGTTADQIIQLVAAIKTKIRNAFGIELQEEVEWFG